MAVDFASVFRAYEGFKLARPRYYVQPGVALRTGDGRLAGDFPDGITTLNSAPTAAEVRVYQRIPTSTKEDRLVYVGRRVSSPAGEWDLRDLKMGARYDVIGRLADYNDVIMADVTPRRVGLYEPLDLSVTYNMSTTYIDLGWTNLSTIPHEIRVYRSDTPFDFEDMPAPLATLADTETEYEDDTVVLGNTYYYALGVAVPSEGLEYFTAEAEGTTP